MLQKEIEDRIERRADEKHPQKDEVVNLLMRDCIRDEMEEGAEIAQSQYEPQLQAKDKEIAAKDERIRLLEEQSDINFKMAQSKDFKIAELQTKYDKVVGLLKGVVIEKVSYPQDPCDRIAMKSKVWDNYCKEKGIE